MMASAMDLTQSTVRSALTFLVALGMTSRVTSVEYCMMESFNATCRQPDELVVINEARYGRMSIGRCVTGSYGQLGCSVDVRRLLDAKCSGRRSCRISMPDPDLFATRPCPGDFTSYLDATYRCQRVEFSDRTTCQRNRALRIRAGLDGRPSSGYLASATTDEYGFGSGDCPWIIETIAGQRINVTLHSYASSSTGVVGGPETTLRAMSNQQQDHSQYHRRRLEVCFEVAVVSDAFERRVASVCSQQSAMAGDLGDHTPRSVSETVIMMSRASEVRIEIINRHMLRSIGAFLLQYKVFGCRTLRNSGDYWYRRDGGTLIVGCNATTDTWFLVCKGTQWVGDVGNCTTLSTSVSGYADWKLDTLFNSDDTFSVGILLVVCIGVAMGILVGGLLLCVVTIFSKRTQQTSTTWFGVLSSKKRPLVPPLADPSLPLRSPGGGTYSTGGATITSDYGWQRTIAVPTGSTCLMPASLTVADPYDCDLVPEGDVDGDQMAADAHHHQQQYQHQYDENGECTTGPIWPVDYGHGVADGVIPGSSAAEMNHGLRWATFRATGTGSPCRTRNAAGSSLSDCPDVETPRSPMTSFGTRWDGVRTLFYEVPSHWQT